MTCKHLKCLIKRVSYVHRFIPDLVELLEPFHKILKKNASFKWGKEQQEAFQKVKDVLSSPLAMISHVKSLSLTFYLISTDKSIDTLLMEEVQGVEHPIYYLNRSLQGVELNYPSIERPYLVLIFATQKLHPYLLAHLLRLATKLNH